MAEIMDTPGARFAEPLASRGGFVLDLRPPRRLGVSIGVLATLVVMAGAVFLFQRVLRQPISLSTLVGGAGILVLLAVATLLAYWTYGCLSLRYRLARGSLVIAWGAVRHVVPLARIQKLLPGEEVARASAVHGVTWPGHWVGHALVPGIGPTLFYSTGLTPERLVYLLTPETAYALSADYGRLRAAIGSPAGEALAAEPARVEHWRLFGLPLWRDRAALVLGGLAIAANVLLFAYVAHAYSGLPEFLPLHFTATGLVDRIGYRAEVLRLPFMAFAVWLVNAWLALLLHERERLAAYLCLGTALVVQVLFLVAVAKIIG